jgi:hypothetical protein
MPSPTLSPTDPVPRGLLTLCPGASSGPQGLFTAYILPIHSQYTAYTQAIYGACKRDLVLVRYEHITAGTPRLCRGSLCPWTDEREQRG